MPSLVPHPRNFPPKWSDHVLIHAVQVAVCTMWISYMTLVLGGLFVGYGAMATIYSPLHPAIAVAMSLMVIGGSALTLWAVVTSTNRLDLSWKAHQIGLLTVGGGWFIFLCGHRHLAVCHCRCGLRLGFVCRAYDTRCY